MMSELKCSVVVPVYNNESTLEELAARIVSAVESTGISFEIVFVDDGSTDRSNRILRELAAKDGRIGLVVLDRNYGGQPAVCAGFERVRGEWVVALDADLDNAPEDIPAMLAPLREGYDLVCGYRTERRAPLIGRQLPSRLLNAYVWRRTGRRVRDLGCGMRAFAAPIVKDLAAEGDARRLLTPLFLRRAKRVAEVPIRSASTGAESGYSYIALAAIALDYFVLTEPYLFVWTATAGVLLGGFALGAMLCGHVFGALAAFGVSVAVVTCSLIGILAQRIYGVVSGNPYFRVAEMVNVDGSASARDGSE